MANIELAYRVRMTCWHGQAEGESIGTNGLGPCLGMIIRKGGQVYCGHMSCAIGLGLPEQKAANLNRIRISTHGVLVNTKVTKPVDAIAFASGQPDATTKAMHAVAKEYFETKEEMHKNFGIYWKDGKVQFAAENDKMAGAQTSPGPESEYDMDGPFNVK